MNNPEKKLLIVEDDPGLQSQLRWCFDGLDVHLAGSREEAIAQFRRQEPGVVLLDLGLPPDPGGVTEGLGTLEQILSLAPETKVIIVTGDNDRSNAVSAIAMGAYDFYQKPVDPDTLTLIVERAYRVNELELENKRLMGARTETPLNGIIGTSPQLLKVCKTIEKIAPSDITTLLLGPSGTGKELFANALHNLSPRAEQPMVPINCAAIPDNLLESELFGHEKGAFTGATKQTIGKIELAHGGTLFLDEIGDLPYELQAKLLRFLQERIVERVGGRKQIPVDIRIICATHQNLPKLIEDGRFREDLYYRISEVAIDIPSLKERDGDALILARAFLSRFNDEYKKSIKGFTKSAITAIENYDWPGNVREIESKIKRAVIMADENQICAEDLQLRGTDAEPAPLNLKQVRDDAEEKAIRRAMEHAGDKITEAAKILGVSRPTLYGLLEKHSIKE